MFMDYKTRELKQEIVMGDDNFLAGAVWQRPLCAWCLSEQGMAVGDGSHGICTAHADWLIKQWRARRGGIRRRQEQITVC
jgi:homoaconitase/3-isopropylmalate dehydratase large subunit